jgi:anti-sigma factor RsiW
MKCHEAQAAIGADPGSQDADVSAHIQGCAECAEYRREMQDMDRLIHRALAVPVEASITLTDSNAAAAKSPNEKRYFGRWQIAASLLASVTLAAAIWIASTRDSIAEQITLHTHHEAFAIVRTDEQADSESVANILAKSSLSLRPNALHVSYASSCPFRGHAIPHLVVQTEQGPVTVLVLANEEPAKTMQRFSEDGYEGIIVPAPRGVLAVLGKDVPLDQAVEKVLWAIEYW